MITRRRFAGAAGAAAVFAGVGLPGAVRAASGFPETLQAELARIERESGGRLGVAVLDTGTGARAGHRADERFPMCSTFKLVLAAAVLARVDGGTESLDRRIRIKPGDIYEYSPVTEPRLGDELTVEALCEAAVVVSDNTAAMLLLGGIGGPPGMTAFFRSLGDPVTRLDRGELELNEAVPGDPRDTTAPAAMVSDLQRLVLGDALTPASREKLTAWMIGCRTGDARLRAGLPKDFRVGDKTGTGGRGSTNDIAVIWPPGRAPVIVAAYLTETEAPPPARNGALAAVGKAVASALAG
ncbi:MAG: class A beta-lactamase [Rhodoplanes sp.]|uniref:class A beta-lactamase n=1 Tax=Rhodoplanes sp. TaxID=1968906 RepID=UPI00182EEA6B|nr:class A beta-lactamase [Rhodoplanes sp.]NVO17758.1 class A beta-lactamase [Rhodoplanes sp.]